MKCEYCDSYLATVPENGVCPNCGGALSALKSEHPLAPIGMYMGTHGRIGMDAMTIQKRIPGKGECIRTIPYGQIHRVFLAKATVSYFGGDGFPKMGWLCIREKKDAMLPNAVGSNAIEDETSITLSLQDNQWAEQLYVFFEKWAERNAEK